MKNTPLILSLALALAPAAAGMVVAIAPAAAAAPAYTTADTDLGTLLDNPATKAVLQKYIATMIANPQIDMARSMTLKQLQPYSGDQLSDARLAQIDADLAKIHPTK